MDDDQAIAPDSGEQTLSRVSGARIHAPARIGVALLAATIVIASVFLAPIVLRSTGSGAGALASHSVFTARLAEQMADRMIAGWSGGGSVAVAAAYVETTCAKYSCAFPDGLPQVSATDAVLVVEVEGWFPQAHRAPRPGDGAATSLIQAYDLTAGIDAPGMLYLFDPASPDVPGTSASAGQRFRELRQFGVPKMLVVNSTSATASP